MSLDSFCGVLGASGVQDQEEKDKCCLLIKKTYSIVHN